MFPAMLYVKSEDQQSSRNEVEEIKMLIHIIDEY